jgi:peroxiredoxin
MSLVETPAPVSQPLPLAVTLTTDHARALRNVCERMDYHYQLLSEKELEALNALNAQLGDKSLGGGR